MLAIGFEVLESGKACDVAKLIETAAQFTLGRSIDSVTNLVTCDGAAMSVAEQDEIFPGGPTSELCLMHSAMKMGQAAVGELLRSRNKVVQNEFREGKLLYDLVHKMAAWFSYSDRLDKLHVYCDTTGCVKIKLQLDINKTRVSAIHNLFLSVIRMKPAIQAYTSEFTKRPAELALSHNDFCDLVVFEGVLEVTKVTCVLSQFEEHANRAFKSLLKFHALEQLRKNFIWVIDVSTLCTNQSPRPTRVKMLISDMSERGQECCRRSALEMERRWCNNRTEVIDNSKIVNTDHDLLVAVLDLRTVLCPHIETTIEMPRLRQLVLDEYVKYGLHEFDLQASRNAAEADEEGGSSSKKKKNGHGGRRKVVRPEAHRPLSIGLTTGDAPAGFGWGEEEEEEEDVVVVLHTPEARQLREKELQKEAGVALKKWRIYGRQLDWAPFLKSAVVPQQKSAVVSVPVLAPQSTKHGAGAVVNTSKSAASEAGPPEDVVMITEESVPAAAPKSYDLIDDLLEADVFKVYRQVLSEEEAQVKVGGKAQFGYFPRMALANIGAMNAESFCERTLSCASLIVTDLHTSLSREEVRMLTMLRMNVSLMEYMRTEYDGLHSRIEASETRINKELRDKAEEQARQDATMGGS